MERVKEKIIKYCNTIRTKKQTAKTGQNRQQLLKKLLIMVLGYKVHVWMF